VLNRYGFTPVNNTATALGATNTQINHRIGCPNASSPQPWKDNVFTLVDADKLYEHATDGTAGLTGNLPQQFHDLMLNESWSGFKNAVFPIVQNEAAKHLGKPSNDPAVVSLANEFYGDIVWEAKGGSYDFCVDNNCNQAKDQIYRTSGGIIKIPFQGRGGEFLRSYFIGSFIDGEIIPCIPGSSPPPKGSCTPLKTIGDSSSAASLALYRNLIHAAMATWPTS